MNYTPSYWEKQFYSHADIVVIGVGFVGLQSAIHLKKQMPKREVWIIDSAAPGKGASLRNAGFSCFGNMGEILDDAKTMGLDAACNLYIQRYKGFELLSHTISPIKMGHYKTGGYEFFKPTEEAELDAISCKINDVNYILNQTLGINPFALRDTDKLGINALNQGIYTEHEGTVQTHLLYRALYTLALETGVKIFNGIHIEAIQAMPLGQHMLQVAKGQNIQTKVCLVCTNAWASKLIPEKVVPARGMILVSNEQATIPWQQLLHNHKGYYYARRLGTRILLGGARHLAIEQETTLEQGINPEIEANLMQFMQHTLAPGQQIQIDYQWTGPMAMGDDRQPIIKKLADGLFCAVKMGGMGLALSASTAKQVSKLVAEEYF